MSKPRSFTSALSAAPKPEAAAFSPTRLKRLDAALRADADGEVIPGAVALVMRAGRLAFFESFGYADRNSHRPMRLDSVFRIASMTKPITVVAALMLLEQGKLLLTDPVSRYLPELGDVKVGLEEADSSTGHRRLTLESVHRPMTVQDLMRHTAGFTYGQFGNSLVQRAYRAAHLMDNQQTNAEMVGKLAQLPLSYQPGTTFEYGMSTDVLGRVVEVVSGLELDRFFALHITEPLGMRATAFGIEAASLHTLAEPQRESAPGAVPAVVPYDPALPAKWFSGGGGLLSTAADYARFAGLLLHGGELDGVRLLSRKTMQLMIRNHLPANLNFGTNTAELGIAAPLPQLGQGDGLGLGVRLQEALSGLPGSAGGHHWGGAPGPYFWVGPAEDLVVIFMLQELKVQRRVRYRSLLRAPLYQAR